MSNPVELRDISDNESLVLSVGAAMLENVLHGRLVGVLMIDPDDRVFIQPAPGFDKSLPDYMASIDWKRQRRLWQEHNP